MTDKARNVSSSTLQTDLKRFQLVWRSSFTNTTGNSRVVVGEPHPEIYTKPPKLFKNEKYNVKHEVFPKSIDYVQKYLDLASNHDIIVPFNTNICLAQEYSPQMQNKIAQYSTLAGNSVVAFGQGIRKITLRIAIIKSGSYWIPYTSALEAMTVMSGHPTRYLGSLFLNGFDQSNPSKSRRYKVVVETLNPIHRVDRNTTIDYEMTFVVAYDYSVERYGKWGKL